MGREMRWCKMHGYILVLYHLCMLWAWIRRHAWGGVGWVVLLWQHLVCSLFAHTYLCLCSTLGPHSQIEEVKWEQVCADQFAGYRW